MVVINLKAEIGAEVSDGETRFFFNLRRNEHIHDYSPCLPSLKALAQDVKWHIKELGLHEITLQVENDIPQKLILIVRKIDPDCSYYIRPLSPVEVTDFEKIWRNI